MLKQQEQQAKNNHFHTIHAPSQEAFTPLIAQGSKVAIACCTSRARRAIGKTGGPSEPTAMAPKWGLWDENPTPVDPTEVKGPKAKMEAAGA